jgi:hypothetical protein
MVALVGLNSSISQPPAFARTGFRRTFQLGSCIVGRGMGTGTLDRGGCDDFRPRHVRVLQPRVVHVGGLGK